MATGIHADPPPERIADRRRQVSGASARGATTRRGPDTPAIDADTERAVQVFLRKLEGKYRVIQGILFGSRARHTNSADSDADVAVVLDGPRGNRTAIALEMAGIAFDVLLETGILVEALPLWADELARPERFSNPALIESIRREGLIL